MPNCQLKTNFIKADDGFDGSLVTYRYEDDLDSDFIGCRILLYTFFHFEKNYDFIAKTNIGELFYICGIDTKALHYKRRATYQLLSDCITWFIDNNYISIINGGSLDDFDYNEMIRIQIIEENFYPSIKVVDGKEKVDEPFTPITKEEFETLMTIRNNQLPKIAFTFAYIKSCCVFRLQGQSIERFPKCALLTHSQIADHIGMHRTKMQGLVDIICDAELLRRKQLTRTNAKILPPYIYTPNASGWEKELYYGKLKYDKKRE